MADEASGVFDMDGASDLPDAPGSGGRAHAGARARTWDEDGLESAVIQALPGFEVLDRELELGSGAEVDLLGTDARGRLVLVCAIEAPDEETEESADQLVLASLDVLAEARGSVELLASHLDGSVRADLAPQLVLVCTHFPTSAARRLAPLFDGDLRLFETRDLSSRRGRSTYLVALEAESSARLPRVNTLLGFLGSLPTDLRVLADIAVARLDRVDESIERASIPGGLEWRSPDGVLCNLAVHAGQLEASLPGSAPERLVRQADVEALVERVLARFVDHYGDGARALEEFPPVELVPHRDSAPILTPEELEAFQQ